LKAFEASSLDGSLASCRIAKIAAGKVIEQGIESMDGATASEFDELDFFFFAGLEADCSSGGDIEAQAICGGAIEGQSAICLEEMEMTADLDWTVAGVADEEAERFSSSVRRDGTL